MKSRRTYLLDEVVTDRPRLNDRGSDAPGRCGSFCAVAAHAAFLRAVGAYVQRALRHRLVWVERRRVPFSRAGGR